MANPFIGRRESVGFGIEATSGTAVAPQAWEKQMKLNLDQATNVAQDKSGLGRVEDIHDSAVTEEWAEGSLDGRVHDLTFGYLLTALFGNPTAALHSGETTVWDNTFSVIQTAPPPTLTFTRSNPLYTRRYSLGVLTDLEITVTTGGFVTYTATIASAVGATSSDVPTYVSVNGFTSKHTVLKYATNVAGLTGATPLQPKSLKLKISRKADRFVPLGQIDPVAFDPESFGVTGEFVTRFTETAEEALALANTRQAVSIAIVNSDVTIGTASHPGLTFTMPQVELKPIKLDDNLDQVLNQTISFTAELNTTLSYMIQALLTNTQNGYAHV
jgi:hypothetical protein